MIKYKQTIGDRIIRGLNGFLLTLLGFVTLYPFIYFLVLSFNDGHDALKGGIYIWPRVFTLDNYSKAFQNPLIANSFKISILRTLICTVVGVLLTAMLAYGISRKNLPGRTGITFFFFFTTLFGGGFVPTFILFRNLHLYNNFWVYVIPGLFSFYNVIIMKTFFDGIPDSLLEAAEIDGCNELSKFFKIVLPLSGPVLATISLFIGVGNWNDWFTGAFYANSDKLMPAATLLNKLLSEASYESAGGSNMTHINNALSAVQNQVTPESLQMAFLIIITFPIICVYPFLQKYFVKGVMIGSIKE